MKQTFIVIFGLVLVLMVGCEKKPAESVASEPLPANLFASAPPAGAVDIVTAKKSSKNGESIVIKGRIGGQKEPFMANRAIMTLADLSLPTCDASSPMEKCPTPWDSCCEPAHVIAAKTISVQVIGPDGRPLKAGLAGVEGLAPLKQVIIAGTARTVPGSDALIVQASQIHVVR